MTAVLENLQATVNSSTVLDASSTSELKQQQLNLKLKAKVREQKLQKQVEELEEELAAARKSAEVRAQTHVVCASVQRIRELLSIPEFSYPRRLGAAIVWEQWQA